MAQTQTTNPPKRRWLERVEVDFSGDRPKTTLKLVVAVDRMKYSQEIGKNDSAILWEGKIPCLSTSVCSVKLSAGLFRRRKLDVKLPFALVEDSKAHVSLPVANSNATVNFTFSEVPDKHQEVSQPAAASSTGGITVPAERADDLDDLATRARSVGQGVGTANAAISGQEVILDKLGRARDLIESINSVVAAVGAIHPVAGVAALAVGSLLEVCKKQEACRDAAKELTNELEILFTIEKYVPKLEDREETREAVERMLKLVAGISDYIRENSSGRNNSSGVFKHFIPGDYGEKIKKFKKEFADEKEAFDRSIRLEAYKIGHDIGTFRDRLESDNH